MELRHLLAKEGLGGDGSSSYSKRSGVFLCQKINSLLGQHRCHKVYIKWDLTTKITRFVQFKAKGTKQLPFLQFKSRYLRTSAKCDQESQVRPGPEDVPSIEAPNTCGKTSDHIDNDSKEKGSLQGAMALIIGTSVGAGILALPARTMNAGFFPTLTSMGLSWSFLLLEALLIAEVNVAISEQHKKEGSFTGLPLCTMAEKTLGPLGGTVAACLYVFLSYTVMVAYIAKSGDILSPLMHISPILGCWVFTLVFGSLTLLGKAKTSAMIGTFSLMIVGGVGIIDWNGLQYMNWGRTPETFPVIFFSLVYHDLMPVLCTYLKGDIQRIRLAVLLGSAVSLAMFILWDAVILCIAPISGTEDPLEFLIRSGGTSIATLIQLFSILALATSFMGTVIGFSAFIKEISAQCHKASNKMQELMVYFRKVVLKSISLGGCKLSVTGSNDSLLPRVSGAVYNGCTRNGVLNIASYVLILAPPLVALGIVSDAFFPATDIAGGYGMTTLYGLFPPIMAWSLHEKGLPPRKGQVVSLLALRRPQIQMILAVSGTCATGLIVSQLMLDLGTLMP